MAHPELTPGWELASDNDLIRLYNKTHRWLVQNGTYSIDQRAKIEGVFKGLPISEDQPRYSFTLQEEEVRELSPRAAQKLKLGGPLELIYWEPCYSSLPDGTLEYTGPNCAYQITYPGESHLDHTYITIHIWKDGSIESDRLDEPRERPKKDSNRTVDDILLDMRERLELEWQTGINRLTGEECEALEMIIDSLIAKD